MGHDPNERGMSRRWVKSRVIGDVATLKALKNVEQKVGIRAIKKATSKAAGVLRRKEKELSRPVSKTISKAIGTKTKSYRKNQITVAIIGVRSQASVIQQRPHLNLITNFWAYRNHDPRHTAHLVEGGTKAHSMKVTVRKAKAGRKASIANIHHPGTKPHSFLQAASDATQGEVSQVYHRVLQEQISALPKAK